MRSTAVTRTITVVGVLAALGLGAGACGSSTTAGSSGTAMSGTPMPTPAGPAGPAHLTTKQGLAVYVFALDTNGKSHCYGQCAVNWPPVPAGTGLESARSEERRVGKECR